MSALSVTDWDRAAGPIPLHDDEQETACEHCAELAEKLAKARLLLRTLRRLEPKPPKADGLEDSPETLAVISHALYIANLRARIDLYLGAEDAQRRSASARHAANAQWAQRRERER